MITIKWPWQRWAKPPPPDPSALAESHSALVEAAVRQRQTEMALRRRRAVIVHNHIATDVRRAMEKRA
jgi:hypothetical protein